MITIAMAGVILLGFNLLDGEYHWWKYGLVKNMLKNLYDEINVTECSILKRKIDIGTL